MRGTDGQYYFVDDGTELSPDEKHYSSGADVFTRNQAVITHMQINHAENIGLPGKRALRGSKLSNVAFGTTARSMRYKRRPQSAQQKNGGKGYGMRSTIHRGSKDGLGSTFHNASKHSRPQTSNKKGPI